MADKKAKTHRAEPFGDRVIIEKKPMNLSPGGIILPEGDPDDGDVAYGIVLALGPGSFNPKTGDRLARSKADVQIGDHVAYVKGRRYAQLKYQDKECVTVQEHDVIYRVV